MPNCLVLMGCSLSRPGLDDQVILLFIGLDGSGTTTTLYQFVKNRFLHTTPTLTLNHEFFEFEGTKVEAYDLGGGPMLRPLWQRYSPEADGVVFSIDSTDIERIQEACNELGALINSDKSKRLPVLVYANKQDIITALPVDVVESVVFSSLTSADAVKVFPSVAKVGKTLERGMNWLISEIAENRANT